ncbi:putative toxin-antitoxin system toxin component, PIN family [Pseudolysinimonas sp.]|uniref:putative toxin-antitoxin system toxin component, PIN family n=1 Tax=Pseudolysinimonas sp. TaxID=2680009 RepID=UPI00286CDB79|nr:putative toxin-antitoxin system toxin component, PIN family [Pseudolysinimonas sp.]
MTPSTPDPAWVVVDSNVWISALVFGGAPRQVFETVVRDALRLVVSAEILTEIRRVVAGKFPDFVDDIETLLGVLHDYLDTIPLGAITIAASRDPDDNRVLETAILGGAAAIVTGDKDLLVLGTYDGVTITTPQDWLERIGATRPA